MKKSLFLGIIAGFLIYSQIAEANFLKDLWRRIFPETAEVATSTPVQPPKPAEEYRSAFDYEERIIKAVEIAAPSVVSIVVTKNVPIIEQCPYSPFGNLPPGFEEFFEQFEFSRPCPKGTQEKEIGGGSGFVVSADGLILTNKHVVSDPDASYTIFTSDGKKYSGKVAATDPFQDLAVVKIKADNLPVLKLGDSNSIKLGQTVVAIGNALGEFSNTVSAGIVSGLSRKITASGGRGLRETLEGIIQTDAAINPGNSGGPLLNLRGEVVGINTAVASGAQNIGFAIPINKAKRDIQSVRSTGKILVSYLGVRYHLITPEVKEKEKLLVDYGVIVRGGEDGPAIMPDSPASKAGILAEDIILEVNGQKVNRDNSLGSLIQQYQVGDTIQLKILRNGKEILINVSLAERKI